MKEREKEKCYRGGMADALDLFGLLDWDELLPKPKTTKEILVA